MINYRTLIKAFILFAISIIATLLLSNKIGPPIEKYETRLYQRISGKTPQHFEYDSMGIPLIVFEGKLGRQYNAVTVAEQSIKWSDENDSTIGISFINCIDWLIKNHSILNDSSILYSDNYDWPSYQMTSPWRSAMNQGRAMQAFIKAYEKTHDTLYLEYARRSMNALFTEVKNGGVTYIDSTGYWFEEYADDSAPQSRVLNGMLVVLQALSDFRNLTGDRNANFLLLQGVDAVKSTLYFYDNNGHSYYDINGKPSNSWYHKFHIELLGELYAETREPIFKEYMDKWKDYKEPSYLEKLIQKPTNIGIFAIFSLFAAVSLLLWFLFYVLFRRN